jgi:RNA polymerase sigma-70 factor (ECF subfamily)
VRRARTGDRDAFGILVHRHAVTVRRLTRAVLQHLEDAEDAAQDAFVNAWLSLPRFDEGQAFGPWLIRIALNAARDVRRRRRVRRTEPVPPGIAAGGRGPDALTEDALSRERMARSLGTLPERQRAALVLFEVEGYSHAEIAALLGIPEGTARSDVFHARRRLRDLLGEEGSKP